MTDLYERGLYAVVITGLVVGSLWNAYGTVEPAFQTWPVLAVITIFIVAAFRGLIAVGPLVAGPAQRSWVLSSAVDRQGALGRRFVATSLGSAASVAFMASAAAVLFGLPVPEIGLMALVAAAAGTVPVAVAVVVQALDIGSSGLLRTCDVLLGTITATFLAGSLTVGLTTSAGNEGLGLVAGWAVASAAVVAVVACIWAWALLGRTRRRRLSSGYALVRALLVSFQFLDAGVIAGLALDRRARGTGRVRSVRLRGSRPVVLLRADLTRISRTRGGLAVFGLSFFVPYLAAEVGVVDLLGAVHLISAFVAADRLAGGLRLVGRSAPLRRAIGGTDQFLRWMHLGWPAVGATLFAVLTSLTVPISPLTTLISLLGALVVVYRTATRPPLDYASSAYDIGLLGPLPVGLVLQLLRGPAILMVLAAVQVWVTTG